MVFVFQRDFSGYVLKPIGLDHSGQIAQKYCKMPVIIAKRDWDDLWSCATYGTSSLLPRR